MRRRVDTLATEEPLEIRLQVSAPGGAETAPVPISITMRTPGHDFELAAGFLFSEGIVRRREAIQGLEYCVGPVQAQQYNTVSVRLRPGSAPDLEKLSRHFYTTSSCGVCGKASLDALRPQVPWPSPAPGAGPRLAPAVLATLPDRLREAQGIFDRTGGLHACGLFDPDGRLLSVREDVGRHNALDKLVGEQLLAGQLPLAAGILVLSGRASFELVQKAAMAGAPVLVAVGAPSSLAASAAEEFGITLAGFARGASFNVYTHPQRVLGPAWPPVGAPRSTIARGPGSERPGARLVAGTGTVVRAARGARFVAGTGTVVSGRPEEHALSRAPPLEAAARGPEGPDLDAREGVPAQGPRRLPDRPSGETARASRPRPRSTGGRTPRGRLHGPAQPSRVRPCGPLAAVPTDVPAHSRALRAARLPTVPATRRALRALASPRSPRRSALYGWLASPPWPRTR